MCSLRVEPRESALICNGDRAYGADAGATTFQSGDIERWDVRNAESNDEERTVENSIPSSVTSSPLWPPHSILLLRSMGVPRPTYLIKGQEPRTIDVAVTGDSFGDGSFCVVLLCGVGECVDEENDTDFEERGDAGGECAEWEEDEIEAGGDGTGERHDRSN